MVIEFDVRTTEKLGNNSSYNFDSSYGNLSSRAEKISNFLFIRRINKHLNEEMSGYVEGKGITCLSVFFQGTGAIELEPHVCINIQPNTIVITQADFCAFNLPQGSKLNTLELLFDTQLLCQQGFDIEGYQSQQLFDCIKKGSSICMSRSISANSVKLINDILSCQSNDVSNKLFIQAKALELLSEHLLCDNHCQKKTIQHSINSTKIHQAAAFIKENYQQPLTINSISRQMGLNEKKLKDGFRNVLQTTVHSYIENTRLTIARERLAEGQRITDVAFEVGYSSPSHFAKRFQKTFGLNPKHWQMTSPSNVM